MVSFNKTSVVQENITAAGDVVAGDLVKNSIHLNLANLPSDVLQNLINHFLQGKSNFENVNWNGIQDVLNSEDAYESIIKSDSPENMNQAVVTTLVNSAAISVKSLDFGKAHSQLGQALTLISENSPRKNRIHREFFLTGLIHYASINDVSGLNTFISTIQIQGRHELMRIANDALQEKWTRSIDISGLKSTTKIIEKLYSVTPEKSKSFIANSLGLAYRRIGERGDVSTLNKAINVFNTGIFASSQGMLFEDGFSSLDTILADLNNNSAITYIRLFEITGDSEYLNNAESKLYRCLKILEKSTAFSDPRNCMIAPNIFNNLGNLWKQRYKLENNPLNFNEACQFYSKAENAWSELNFPYFWAVVQKNKGDIKYIKAKYEQSNSLLQEALNHCVDSLRYRKFEASSHQWAKSIEIMLEILLSSKECAFDISLHDKVLQEIINVITLNRAAFGNEEFSNLLTKYDELQLPSNL